MPDGELMEEARALAQRLAAGPTRSYANSKRALNNSLLKIMDEQLDLEADIQCEMVEERRTSSRACPAFVEKRDPRFTGQLARSEASARSDPPAPGPGAHGI